MRFPLRRGRARDDDRRFRLYGVGAAKSGTHSLAAIFERYRTAHEPEPNELIPRLCDAWERGKDTSRDLRRYLKDKDRRLRLEADVSQLNGVVAHELVRLYPDARFLLTVRHPRDWVDSMCNHILNATARDYWERWRRLRFGERDHPPEEAPLAERNLFTLRGYLRHWAWHQSHVLDTVPADRLLVLPTVDIGNHVRDFAELVGVPMDTLNADGAHAFSAKQRFGVIDELDDDYVEAAIAEVCGPVLRRLPPLG